MTTTNPRPPRRRPLRRAADPHAARLRMAVPGWLAPVLGAVLLAVLGFFAKDLIGVAKIHDEAVEHLPGGHPEIHFKLTDIDNNNTVALPKGVQVSPELQRYLSLGTIDGGTAEKVTKVMNELESSGAPTAAQTNSLLLISGRRQPIVVTNIVPVELRRGPAHDGALAILPSQGGDPSMMVFDFDHARPYAHAVNDQDLSKVGGLFFASKTLPLSDKHHEAIILQYKITKGSVSFKLRIDYLFGTRPGSIIMSDSGRPYRLTAFNCTGRDRASYQQALQTVWPPSGGVRTEPVENPREIRVIDC